MAAFGTSERMLAMRYLRSRRQEGFISVIAWFSLIALAGMIILAWAGRWHIRSNIERAKNATAGAVQTGLGAIWARPCCRSAS